MRARPEDRVDADLRRDERPPRRDRVGPHRLHLRVDARRVLGDERLKQRFHGEQQRRGAVLAVAGQWRPLVAALRDPKLVGVMALSGALLFSFLGLTTLTVVTDAVKSVERPVPLNFEYQDATLHEAVTSAVNQGRAPEPGSEAAEREKKKADAAAAKEKAKADSDAAIRNMTYRNLALQHVLGDGGVTHRDVGLSPLPATAWAASRAPRSRYPKHRPRSGNSWS